MTKKQKIRELNIAFWRHPQLNGRLMLTDGISELGPKFIQKCIFKLKVYNEWNKDHDPHGEADMCVFEIDGNKVWAKLDYYDKSMEYGSEDPSDPTKTLRIGTLLFPSEY